jgi:hypothetical protein
MSSVITQPLVYVKKDNVTLSSRVTQGTMSHFGMPFTLLCQPIPISGRFLLCSTMYLTIQAVEFWRC